MSPPDTIRNPRLISLRTNRPGWERKFDAAVDGLRDNTQRIPNTDESVLIEGGKYQGIWLECGPLESVVLAAVDPAPALAAHRLFLTHQKPDGQIPCFVRKGGAGWSQVQTVTPLVVTAVETALHWGDRRLLAQTYEACGRWDDWLAKYRDRRGLGLCEAFCEYDTGHDNSPRFAGLPKICTDRDARQCPKDPRLPYLAPDLSASLYAGRVALAELAQWLGHTDEAADWEHKATKTREAIHTHCFDRDAMCFFDRDATGTPVSIVGDVLLRVLAEGVVDQDDFDEIFHRWIADPQAFWPTLPLPSIALCDPAFPQGELPDNSWGGASQCLTALRAPRWLEAYGRYMELTDLMVRWLDALAACDGFQQQADPRTGRFQTTEDYSPAMCVVLDHLTRLTGIARHGRDEVSFGCWSPGEDYRAACHWRCDTGEATLTITGVRSEIAWDGQPIATIEGSARAIASKTGQLKRLIGIAPEPVAVTLTTSSGCQQITLAPNEVWLAEDIHSAHGTQRCR